MGGEYYITKAYEQSVISEPTFSIYLDRPTSAEDTTGNTYMDFGTPNSATIGGTTPLYLPIINNDPWWTAEITGLYLSDDPSTLYTLTAAPALTDSGSTAISGPGNEVKAIYNMMTSYFTNSWSNVSGWGPVFDCTERDNLPSLYFAYGDYWFEVPPKDFVLTYDWDYDWCAFSIDSYDDEYWILGGAFMRGYYIIHDMANAQQGFVPVQSHDGTTKSMPVAVTTQPSTPLPAVGLSTAAWIGIGVGSAVVVGGIVWLLIAFLQFFSMAFKGGKPKTTKKSFTAGN